MANQVTVSRPKAPENGSNQVRGPRLEPRGGYVPNLSILPEMHQSLLVSLYHDLKDALFPEKLPPLRLSSKPVPVREIWSRGNTKKATTGSLVLHALGIGAL